MRCVVTGAAGFIGSHLCESLLAAGHTVTGIDAFIPYYPKSYKDSNLASLAGHEDFRFLPIDLRTDDLTTAIADAEVVFHLAGMPGLVKSWIDFDGYWTCNVLGTHRLLEALRTTTTLKRFLYVSTSSVYGRFASGDESLPTKPISPYGVTKLAGEQLARAHLEAFEFPLVVLRYFSVYGPRQRPDMGYHIFMDALLHNRPITLFGDGQQVRGNTYVSDCVAATMAAVNAGIGETFNVGGGEMASVWDILHQVERIAGKKFDVKLAEARAGDQRHTFADTTKLRRQLGWSAQVSLEEGLARQWAWHVSRG